MIEKKLRSAIAIDKNAVSKRDFGSQIELSVEQFLQQHGLRTITHQSNTRYGEIDLVMRDADVLVFVEVRYRASDRFGGGLVSVDTRKQARLRKAAEIFLSQHHVYASTACRFDVVAVSGPHNKLIFDWVKDAIHTE